MCKGAHGEVTSGLKVGSVCAETGVEIDKEMIARTMRSAKRDMATREEVDAISTL